MRTSATARHNDGCLNRASRVPFPRRGGAWRGERARARAAGVANVMRKGQAMKRFVALCVLASALFGFTGCQPRAEPAASSAVLADEPAPLDMRDLGVLQAT